MRPVLIVMVKLPRPGQVKTRLGRDIGPVAACWWYRHQVAALLRRLRDPRWRIVLAVAPEGARAARAWPADLPRWGQGQGDLGARMARLLGRAAPCCLIGSDIPGVTRAHVARAFGALGCADWVFGPAPDGGFWLVGARRAPLPGVWQGVRWSSEHSLSDSIARLTGRVAFVDVLQDVDTGADLAATRRSLL